MDSALYMFMPSRKKDLAGIYFVTLHVIIPGGLFNGLSVILQLITGIALLSMGGYIFTGACWFPVDWKQMKMRNIEKEALVNNSDQPKTYGRYDKWWITLGSLAFPAIMIMFYVMVFKPA